MMAGGVVKLILKNIAAMLLGLTVIVLGLLFAVLAVTSLLFWEIIGVVVLLDASWLVGAILISKWRDWRKKCA